jgi:hypothetical protein
MGTLREYVHAFLITTHLVLLRVKNVSEKSCRENPNACFRVNNFILENCDIHGKLL